MAVGVGTVITVGARKYLITNGIASGGFGTVFRAAQIEPVGGLEIAVKIPAPHVLANPIWAKKFEREARILANVSHPNVVRIIGFWTFTDGGMALAQELVQGATELNEYAKSHPDETPSLVAQALYALHAIHGPGNRRAAIHRDISPRNLLVDCTGRLKLIDFGLAKEDPRDTTVLTQAGDWFGTRGCMAPEQTSAAADVDARADLYALGRSIAAVVQDRNPLFAEPNRLPPPWVGICTKLTEHERDDRCASALDALELAFAEFASARTAVAHFHLHVQEMHGSIITYPKSWPAVCQIWMDSKIDLTQDDIETLALIPESVYSDAGFDAGRLHDVLEASSAIAEFDSSFIDFDDLDPTGAVYRALYPALDQRRKEESFRRVAKLAVRGHRYTLMNLVRSICGGEPDPLMKAQLVSALDEVDPTQVIEGRGVVPGRTP